jgi:hypothetical protein
MIAIGIYNSALRRFERSNQMKYGPPSTEVTTPTGISVGAITVRASVSQITRNPAPTKKAQGNRMR